MRIIIPFTTRFAQWVSIFTYFYLESYCMMQHRAVSFSKWTDQAYTIKMQAAKFFPDCVAQRANDTEPLPRRTHLHFTTPAESKVSSFLSVSVISTMCDMRSAHHSLLDLKILIIFNASEIYKIPILYYTKPCWHSSADHSHIVMNWRLQHSRKATNNKASPLKPAQNKKRRHKEA